MANTLLFVAGLLSHWIAIMSGIVALGVGAYQYFRAKKLAPTTWVLIGLLCLFFAAYQTWLDEHEARVKAEERPELSPYHWQMLTSEESLRLRAAMRNVPPQGEAVYILCAEADCDDLAKSFRDVFRELHWHVECCSWGQGTFDPGVHIWAANDQLRSVAGKIEEATSGRLKVDTSGSFTMDPNRFFLQITIGAKS